MAVELNIGAVRPSITSQTDLTQGGEVSSGNATLAPIMSGESLKVTSGSMSNLEKLVAKIKEESETTRQSLSQRRLSILQTTLDSMADKISAADRANLLEIESLNGQKEEEEKALTDLKSDKSATEGRISTLDIQIEALEKQIAQAVQDGADHREQVAKLKEQRAEEQAKLDQINGAIKSTTSKIADIDAKIAKGTAAIGSTTLNEVAAALREAAGSEAADPERAESEAERTKKEAKSFATDIARQISEALDKIDDQIRKSLEEAQELVKA